MKRKRLMLLPVKPRYYPVHLIKYLMRKIDNDPNHANELQRMNNEVVMYGQTTTSSEEYKEKLLKGKP